MTRKTTVSTFLAVLAVLATLLMLACGGGSEQLSRDEVAEIARGELAGAAPSPDPGLTAAEAEQLIQEAIAAIPGPEPGITRDDVAEIVAAAIAEIQESQPGLTMDEVREVVEAVIVAMPEPAPSLADVQRAVEEAMASMAAAEPAITREEVQRISRNAVASIPSKSAPAQYTQFVVGNAISRYESDGLDSTVAHYNRLDSVDGQWYVFIIDENGGVISHYDPHLLGEDLSGPVGTDANGYNFGPEILSADENGKWVSYVYNNPETGGIGGGDFELKNVWVERRDGLLFASGWYIDANEFTRQLVSEAVEKYRQLGLAGTMSYFASPVSTISGLDAAVAYYNTAETADGQWFAFIGDPSGKIVGHSDLTLIGGDSQDLLGEATFDATEEGQWLESESLRVWVAGYDGHLFGSGWRRN